VWFWKDEKVEKILVGEQEEVQELDVNLYSEILKAAGAIFSYVWSYRSLL
jgi:hypothetical protein